MKFCHVCNKKRKRLLSLTVDREECVLCNKCYSATLAEEIPREFVKKHAVKWSSKPAPVLYNI